MSEGNHPSTNGVNGREHNGRFAVGNPGGPGNPNNRKVLQFKAALMAAVTEEDIVAVVRALVEAAKAGDVQAARLILDRTLGPLTNHVELSGEPNYGRIVVALPARKGEEPDAV